MKKKLKKIVRRNPVARDLFTPKYRMRVVRNKKKDSKNTHKINNLQNPAEW
jgi:hypothetical protein